MLHLKQQQTEAPVEAATTTEVSTTTVIEEPKADQVNRSVANKAKSQASVRASKKAKQHASLKSAIRSNETVKATEEAGTVK